MRKNKILRVMFDTNVLLLALLFPGVKINSVMRKVTSEHHLILSSFVIGELMRVTREKFPNSVASVCDLLKHIPYELVYTPEHPTPGLFVIRDVTYSHHLTP